MKKMNGSLTAEAAFVVPVVIFVICAMCYMGFYVHDKAVAESVIQKYLERWNLYVKSTASADTGEISYEHIADRGLFYYLGDKKNEEIENFLRRELETGLRIMKVNQINTQYSRLTLSAEVELEMKVSIPVVSAWFNQKVRSITCDMQVHMPEEFARMYDTLQTFMDDSGKNMLEDYYYEIKGIGEMD